MSARVRVGSADAVASFLTGYGLELDAVLGDVGLTRSLLYDRSAKIELARFCGLFERASELTGKSTLGLEFGSGMKFESLGFLGYLAISAATVNEALSNFVRFLPLHQDGTVTTLETHYDDQVAITYRIVDRATVARRQDAELAMSMVLGLLRTALGRHWAPSEVHFEHRRAGSMSYYERVLGAPILFQQTSNRLIFSRDVLSAPMPRSDPTLFNLIAAEFNRQKPRAAGRVDLEGLVRHHVQRLVADGGCSLEATAQACGLEPWTLTRRLHDNGLSFQKLVQESRLELALHYLQECGMSVSQTAMMLGYSELSAFSRAFRQWSGTSPRKHLSGQRAVESRTA